MASELLTSALLLFAVTATCYQQVQQQQQQSLFSHPNQYFSPGFATSSYLNGLNFQNFNQQNQIQQNQQLPPPQQQQHPNHPNYNHLNSIYNGYLFPSPAFPQLTPQHHHHPQPINPHNPYFPSPIGPIPPYPTPAPGIPNIFQGFQLPRQVRVPGKIEINISGNDAEIICEFPRYLLLVQKLHWHFRFDDPYGSFYDESNNFAPRVTVVNVSKYKTILQIRNFGEDDFGKYKCISAAILPNESDNENYVNFPNLLRIGAASTTTEISKRIKKRSFYPTTFKPPVFAPFYKPSYGLFGVFLDIQFSPGSRVSFVGGNRLANIKAAPGEDPNNANNSSKIFVNKL